MVPEHPVLFYDGECGFCDRTVRFVLARDKKEDFRFAPLQSDAAKNMLSPLGADPRNLDTLYVLAPGPHGPELLSRARAAFYIATRVGLGALIWPLRALPWRLLDVGYDLFAKYRYQLFGRRDACAIPTADERRRFL
jgi:predicted DCC family thiol-disulfide oxidoreductase YuxK